MLRVTDHLLTQACSNRLSKSITVLLIFVILHSTGCVTANFSKPIASFQKSTNTASAALGEYFVNVNDFERQLYLDDIALDPNKQVFWQISGNPTALAGNFFKPEAIRARTTSLRLLATFAERLGELAASDAPKQFSANAKSLGENVTSLANTFGRLAETGDSNAGGYIGPISALVGTVGRLYLERQRDEAIREALEKGAPQVYAILSLLEKDLNDRIKPLLETGHLERLATTVNYYNNRAPSDNTLQRRRELLKYIHSLAVMHESSIAFNPSGIIQTMKDAFDALVTYARNSKTPTNFADLVSALEAFDQNASEIAKQVELIRKAANGR